MKRDTEPGQGRKQRLLRELNAGRPGRANRATQIAAFIALALVAVTAILDARQGAVETRIVSVAPGHAR